MTPYVRFCSCQLTAAALLQRKTENSPEFVEVHKVSDGVLVYGSVTHKCNDVSIPRSGPAWDRNLCRNCKHPQGNKSDILQHKAEIKPEVCGHHKVGHVEKWQHKHWAVHSTNQKNKCYSSSVTHAFFFVMWCIFFMIPLMGTFLACCLTSHVVFVFRQSLLTSLVYSFTYQRTVLNVCVSLTTDDACPSWGALCSQQSIKIPLLTERLEKRWICFVLVLGGWFLLIMLVFLF